MTVGSWVFADAGEPIHRRPDARANRGGNASIRRADNDIGRAQR
jgi:hypothetical protein